MLLHRIDDGTCCTVARVDNDLVGLQLAHIDVGKDVLDIFIENIHLLDFSGNGCGRRIGLADRHCRNILEPRIA